MKKFLIIAVLLIASLGTSPLVAYQSAENRVDLVTIDVREKDLAEVLAQISEQVDVNIIVDPQVSEQVTLSLDAIGWHEALEIIARQTSCVIIESSDRLIRFTQPPSVNIEFQDADLAVVLDLLAKQSGANIVIAEEVEGKVSLTLRDVPWREALYTIVKTAGYVVVSEREGISEILRIVHPDKLVQQQETRIFRLRYIRPPEQYVAIISDIDKQAGNVSRDNSAEVEGEFTLLKALRKALSPGGDMDFDIKTNSIIVKDIAPRLDEIEEIIAKIDVEPALVQVEVKFISTTSDDILEAGLKFDDPNTPGRDGFRLSAYGSSPLSGTPDLSGTGSIVDPATGPIFPGSVAHNGGTWPFDIGNMQSIGVP